MTLWTVHWDFPGKNTGVGCPALLRGNLLDPRIKPTSLMSLALTGQFLSTSTTWKALLKPQFLLLYQCNSTERAQLCGRASVSSQESTLIENSMRTVFSAEFQAHCVCPERSRFLRSPLCPESALERAAVRKWDLFPIRSGLNGRPLKGTLKA